MNKRLRFLFLLLVVGVFGVLVVVFHPQAEEVDHGESPAVSDADLQMYIKVYTAMQDDHDLTIDNAIKPYDLSLDGFRQIERRIQNEARLVERVRQALLDHVKDHSMFAQAMPKPPAAPTPAKPKERHPTRTRTPSGKRPHK